VAYRDLDYGQLFGELAAIDGRERSASVMALEPVRLARLSEAAFRELVDDRPNIRWALLHHLSTQLRRITERVFEFSTLVVRKRLVRELLRLASDNRQGNCAMISPAPSHAELAARISTHREAVSREMSALAKQKLVERRGRLILLRDAAALTKVSDEEA
jgi:CRP-like cAMP-binding protein